MRNIRIIVTLPFIALFFLLFACQSKVDIEKLEQELLDLHQTTIDAHLNKDVNFFIKDISDDYMQVQRGEFIYPVKEDIYAKFTEYLNNTEFSVYKDVQEPIVRVANDGSIGWTIVQVKISGERKQENDSIYNFDFTCAWITMYERENDKWIRIGEVDNYKISE